MLKRSQKNLPIWLIFGAFLGTHIARALSDPAGTSLWYWMLIVAGIGVAILHYLPDKPDS